MIPIFRTFLSILVLTKADPKRILKEIWTLQYYLFIQFPLGTMHSISWLPCCFLFASLNFKLKCNVGDWGKMSTGYERKFIVFEKLSIHLVSLDTYERESLLVNVFDPSWFTENFLIRQLHPAHWQTKGFPYVCSMFWYQEIMS